MQRTQFTENAKIMRRIAEVSVMIADMVDTITSLTDEIASRDEIIAKKNKEIEEIKFNAAKPDPDHK